MCGRYSLDPSEFSELRLPFRLTQLPLFPPRYNIAPTYQAGYEVPIIRLIAGATPSAPPPGNAEAVLARWWFIPRSFKKSLDQLPTTFNARSEDLGRKVTWAASFESRRCLVPATGWREFVGARGKKRAFQFHLGEPFFFAGLWDSWCSPDGENIDSFAIVTAAASGAAESVHSRMPIVVPKTMTEMWVVDDARRQEILTTAIQQQTTRMQVYEVSAHGNSIRAEGPECIAPLRAGAKDQVAPNEQVAHSRKDRQLKLF